MTVAAAMAASWTSSGLLVLLLSLCVTGPLGAASAAVMRGRQRQEGNLGNLGNPLALMLLRGTLGDGGNALQGLEPASADELDALKVAMADLASPRMASAIGASSDGDLGDTVFLRAAKRQVRYHQCYFNPISCFG